MRASEEREASNGDMPPSCSQHSCPLSSTQLAQLTDWLTAKHEEQLFNTSALCFHLVSPVLCSCLLKLLSINLPCLLLSSFSIYVHVGVEIAKAVSPFLPFSSFCFLSCFCSPQPICPSLHLSVRGSSVGLQGPPRIKTRLSFSTRLVKAEPL